MFDVRLRSADPLFLRALVYFSPAPMASVIGTLGGILFFCFPFLLLSIAIPFVLIIGAVIGFPISVPVTFGVLPLVAVISRNLAPIWRGLVLVLSGTVSGYLVTLGVAYLGSKTAQGSNWPFALTGGFGGFVAGCYTKSRKA